MNPFCHRRLFRHRKIWLCCSGFGCFGLIWFLWTLSVVIYESHCSDEDSINLLQITCEWYKQGYIVGNLCPALCDENQVRYNHCTNYKSGKTVLVMDCDHICSPGEVIPAILKSHYPDIDKFEQKFLGFDGMVSTTLVEFKKMIEDLIFPSSGMNVTNSDDVIKLVFESNYDHYLNALDDKKYKAFILSVWSLVQQEEYLITKLNQESPLFPRIYHSCGSFYLMEFAPPGHILNPPLSLIKSDPSTWEERVNIALKLLDGVLYMETQFYQPLHMCDIKDENFGIGVDGKVKLIDTDTVFFESKLLEELASNEKCSRNSDCNFWDCHGVCSNGACLKQRLNNNLQSVIEDIFMPSLPVFKNGLLRYPPAHIKDQLQTIFQSSTAPFPGQIDEKVSMDTYWKLYNLLRSTLDQRWTVK